MWQPYNKGSFLDQIASDFLLRHGYAIAPEPGSQVIGWVGHRARKGRGYVPLAAFLDLPRPMKGKTTYYIRDCACGAPTSGLSCDRCYKRTTRENFIAKWNARASDGESLLSAVLTQAAWEGGGDERYRIVISPEPTEREERSVLVEAFADAIERNAEPEDYRRILCEAGFGDVLEARDTRRDEMDAARIAKAAAPRKKADPVPELKLNQTEAAAAARDMIAKPKFRDGSWWNTRTRWAYDDSISLQVLCAAGVSIDDAATALGRSPQSVAWRARDTGLALPVDWLALVRKPSKIIVERQPLLSYPYLMVRRPEHADLLMVHRIVPQHLPGREDVCQEIMLAMWEGKVTLDDLIRNRSNLRQFIGAFREKNFERGGFATSLDATVPGTDDLRLIDTI